LVLANLPADPQDRRRALWVAGALILTFLVVAPFAGEPLAPFPGFVLIYQAALVIVDLITAVFLFGLLRVTGSRAILVLACGYVFTACMAVAHGLSFPGAFTPNGLLDGGESTPWLFFFWHAAFPLVVLAYVILRRHERIDADGRAVVPGETRVDPERFARWASLAGSAAAVAAAIACTLVVAYGNDYFPALAVRNHFSLGGTGIGWILLAVTLASLAALLTRRPYSILDLWLSVVLCAWAVDISLVSLLNHARYDHRLLPRPHVRPARVGLMMVVLLAEQSKFYAALVDAQQRDAGGRRAAGEPGRPCARDARGSHGRLVARPADRARLVEHRARGDLRSRGRVVQGHGARFPGLRARGRPPPDHRGRGRRARVAR
jgi:hypothetical protein